MSMVAWMIYSVGVGVPLAAAAWLLERALLALGRPVRWVWVAALGAAMGVPAWAVGSGVRTSFPIPSVREAAGSVMNDPGQAILSSVFASALGGFAALRDWAGGSAGSAISRIVEGLPFLSGIPDRVALFLWMSGSLSLLLVAILGSLRLSRTSRSWPRTRIEEEDVRISPTLGPAVVGFAHPEIVLPLWLLESTQDRLKLILLHEREHIRGRDTLLLALGVAGSAAIFWNPIGWWVLGRLRGAVELDCDRRVLRTGVSRREYGRLLLDVGAGSRSVPLPIAALAEPTSLLERRLNRMKTSMVRGRLLPSMGAAILALLLVVVACETPTPTLVEERPLAEPEAAGEAPRIVLREDAGSGAAIDGAPSPLVFIDGEVAGPGALAALARGDVVEVRIVKGAEALELYGEDGRAGVIRIKTKDRNE